MQQLRLAPYDEASGRGVLRYLQLTAVGREAAGLRAEEDSEGAGVQVRGVGGGRRKKGGQVVTGYVRSCAADHREKSSLACSRHPVHVRSLALFFPPLCA